jgi:hypothetical protein
VIYVSATESACFKSLKDASNFLTAFGNLENVECVQFSLLLSPGRYLMEAHTVFKYETDFVGNRSHKSLHQLKDDGMKSLEGDSATSDSVVLKFAENLVLESALRACGL